MFQQWSKQSQSNSCPARSTVTSSTPDSSLGPINFAPIATGTNFNMNIPFEISKASDDISRNVPQSLKQKVIAGEFIDLSNLLCNIQNSSGNKQTITIVQGQLVLQLKMHDIKINVIDTYNYISIYCTVHSNTFQDLLKYMQLIRLGANRCASLNWKLYDEQYRLRKAQEPSSSWANVDTKLWLFVMQPSVNIGNTLQENKNVGFLKCYAYNYQGNCTLNSCIYKHACLRCNGTLPVISCMIGRQVAGNPQSPGIVARFRATRPFQMPRQRNNAVGQFSQHQSQNVPRFRSLRPFMGQW